MDKQMIEEMAKEIAKTLFDDCLLNNGGHCEDCECNREETKEYDCQSYLVAKKILEKYQPKIPEGGVVLTKEEYSDYLVLKDAHQNAIERCEKLQADNERLYKNIGKFKDTVRKETAEKIFSTVFADLKRYAHIHEYAETAKQTTAVYDDCETPIEMQSVWDVLTLKKFGMAEYENMTELQDNIEYIAKSRLLAEIEKDMGVIQREICKEITDGDV